jgi:hypothetical protein
LTPTAGDTGIHRSGAGNKEDQQNKIHLTEVSTVSGDCQRTDLLDMWVIFMDISAGQGGLSSVEMEARRGCCRSMFDSVC